MEEHSDIAKKISKIRIKKEHKKSFLKELSVVGINESTLFPEMEYQVKDIKKLYTSINDEQHISKFINNLAYEASAGSGKTFMLVVCYLSLMFGGAAPSMILALTFTNKAAREMQERVVLTLEKQGSR